MRKVFKVTKRTFMYITYANILILMYSIVSSESILEFSAQAYILYACTNISSKISMCSRSDGSLEQMHVLLKNQATGCGLNNIFAVIQLILLPSIVPYIMVRINLRSFFIQSFEFKAVRAFFSSTRPIIAPISRIINSLVRNGDVTFTKVRQHLNNYWQLPA